MSKKKYEIAMSYIEQRIQCIHDASLEEWKNMVKSEHYSYVQHLKATAPKNMELKALEIFLEIMRMYWDDNPDLIIERVQAVKLEDGHNSLDVKHVLEILES